MVDKRALYLMVCELAREVEGKISENVTGNWITLEKFKEKHKKILSSTFEGVNERSLRETEELLLVDESDENDINC